jgi:hypothetical protein
MVLQNLSKEPGPADAFNSYRIKLDHLNGRMGSSSLGGSHQFPLLQPIVKISEGGLHGMETIYRLKESKAWQKKGDETSPPCVCDDMGSVGQC